MSDFNNAMNEFFAMEKSFEVGYKEGYKDAVEKACELLKNRLPSAMVRSDNYMFNGEFIEDIKKAMEGGEK